MALQNVDAAMRELLRSQCALAPSGPAYETVRARLSAMHLCLTSSTALLGITHRLTAADAVQTNEDRVKAGKQLADQTKVAGRAAYRAGLMLTDPRADDDMEQGADSFGARRAQPGGALSSSRSSTFGCSGR
jgi:hypothetical protein